MVRVQFFDPYCSMLSRENLLLWHTVRFINDNCTHSAEHEGILQGFSRASLHLVWARASGEENIWLAIVTLLSVARNSLPTMLLFFEPQEMITTWTPLFLRFLTWPTPAPSERWVETWWWHKFSSYHQPDHACGWRGKEVSESRDFCRNQLANK